MTKKSIFSRINQSEEPEIDSLTQNRSNNKLIQDIESHLNSLIDSLQKGEFPVNIKKITQVFDGVVTIDRLPIDVPADKFVDLYNDLPNILTGYAIGATLSDESYREPDVSQITFQRLDRGTYWIFPTDRIDRQGAAWLVPNPLKDIKIERNKSLNFSFDIDSSSQNNSNILILTKPALVQILPNSDRLTWKLTERGELRTGGTASQPATANNASIDPLALTKQIEQIVQAKLRSAHSDILKKCQELIDRSTNNTIDRVNSAVDLTSQPTSQRAMAAKEYAKRANQKKKENDFAGASADYDRAISLDAKYANYEVAYQQAELAYIQGDYQKAKNIIDVIANTFDHDPSVRLLRGHIYCYGLNDFETGKNEYILVLSLTTDDEFTQFAQKGLEYAKSAISSENRSTVTQSAPPVTTSSQGTVMTAEDYFKKAKQKEQQNDSEGALVYYDMAIKLNPDYANAYFNRGMLEKNSLLAEDKIDAIESLRTAARLYKQQGKLDIYQSLSETLQKL
jgi:tetratricopeptide (TPR) repeat protein